MIATTMRESFVIQFDIPSIKSYVFGTDPLNEIRGASARLDWLNREEMERILHEHSGSHTIRKVYANGGSAQFVVGASDEWTVEIACRAVVRHIRQQTGGEVRTVYGIGALSVEGSYRSAVRSAHFRMRCQREFATGHYSLSGMPMIMECDLASHLPAAYGHRDADGNPRMLSESSYQKLYEGRKARTGGLWDGWMHHLGQAGPWPTPDDWANLRYSGITDLGEHSSWRDHVGVVYADGNAMGTLVQALDTPETYRQFSTIVDESIREACYSSLYHISRNEVERVRLGGGGDSQSRSLPADILLLGGDDLLVAVPADRALDFALNVTGEFERLTREKFATLQDEDTRRFFGDLLVDRGVTISCGVAIVKATYPFYLSLDLAEQLLKNAKRLPGASSKADLHDPTRIDFHVVAAANSSALHEVREQDYHTSTDASRTLRPLSRSQLQLLRDSARELGRAGLPRSKLHELRDASLTQSANLAGLRIRDIFARCRHDANRSQRGALWNAIKRLCPDDHDLDFPWFRGSGRRVLCVVDIVDACNLFPAEGTTR